MKTSKRINFATDEWSGQDVTHIELQWGGQTIRLNITDEKIRINTFGLFKQTATNVLEITNPYPQ